MPIVNLQIMEGHDAQRKAALLRASSQAIVDSIGAPVQSVRIMLQELPPAHVIVAGELGAPLVQYQVFLIEGRTPELKSALIKALNDTACATLGATGEQVRVMVTDVPKTDMGVANGISALAAGR